LKSDVSKVLDSKTKVVKPVGIVARPNNQVE
jgi:hypothetical protein